MGPRPGENRGSMSGIREKFLTLARSEGDPTNHPALYSAHTGALSPPRPRFARSRVLPAFSRPLQIEFGSVSD
jgi:hypothetical protein